MTDSMPRRLSPQSLRASFPYFPLNSMRVSDPLQRFPIAMQSPGFSMCSLSTILGVLLEICSKCKQGILVITPSSFHHPSHHFCHLSPCFMFSSCSHHVLICLQSLSLEGLTWLRWGLRAFHSAIHPPSLFAARAKTWSWKPRHLVLVDLSWS